MWRQSLPLCHSWAVCFKAEKKCRKTVLWGFLLGSLSLLFCNRRKLFPNFFSLQLWRSRGIRAVLSHMAVRNVFRGDRKDLCIPSGRMEGLVSSGGGGEGCKLLCGKRRLGKKDKKGIPLHRPLLPHPDTGAVLNPPAILLPWEYPAFLPKCLPNS